MLTRLKAAGFKNLVDVDVRFGPFTCIAGANGVGKSNLFDAIAFLSALADRPLLDAVRSVRGAGAAAEDLRSLFHQGDDPAPEIAIEADLIVPAEGVDDLGQRAVATTTFLRYAVTLAYRPDDGAGHQRPLEIVREELAPIPAGDAEDHLLFPHSARWQHSAVKGRRRSAPFIATEGEGQHRTISVRPESEGDGRPRALQARDLPRTVLSAADAEWPTALLARREMQSWRVLHLEPAALRQPDDFGSPTTLGHDGSHLAAALYRLAHAPMPLSPNGLEDSRDPVWVYAQIAGRLMDFDEGVRTLAVDRDDERQRLTLYVTDRTGVALPARALSDGALRLMALALLFMEVEPLGLLCLEEPENGIHPDSLPALLRLLRDIAVDADVAVGLDNPLRQVILNTHSSVVVSQVPDESLLIAQRLELRRHGRPLGAVGFSGLPATWRDGAPGAGPAIAKGRLLPYLNPLQPDRPGPWASEPSESGERNGSSFDARHPSSRVMDRDDLQELLGTGRRAG